MNVYKWIALAVAKPPLHCHQQLVIQVPFGRSDLNFISFFQLSCKSFPAPDLPNVCHPASPLCASQTSSPGAWLQIGIGTAVQSHRHTKQFSYLVKPYQTFFIGPRCPWGPIYGSDSLSLSEWPCWNLTDVTLADEDTNSILTDNANRAMWQPGIQTCS